MLRCKRFLLLLVVFGLPIPSGISVIFQQCVTFPYSGQGIVDAGALQLSRSGCNQFDRESSQRDLGGDWWFSGDGEGDHWWDIPWWSREVQAAGQAIVSDQRHAPPTSCCYRSSRCACCAWRFEKGQGAAPELAGEGVPWLWGVTGQTTHVGWFPGACKDWVYWLEDCCEHVPGGEAPAAQRDWECGCFCISMLLDCTDQGFREPNQLTQSCKFQTPFGLYHTAWGCFDLVVGSFVRRNLSRTDWFWFIDSVDPSD